MSDGFRRTTAVYLRDTEGPATAPGDADVTRSSFDAEVHDGWDIGGNANGGYLLAIAARAMAEVVGRPPLTITAHYLRPAPAGPCVVEVEVVRSGRRLATVSASLVQDDKAVLRALGTFGAQQPGGPSHDDERPVDLPSWDECALRPATSELPGLLDRVTLRIHPDDIGYATGEPSGDALIRGWFDLRDGEPIDTFALLLAADSFTPPIFNTGLPVAWVPTIELTVHVRGEPAPGPLRCRFRSRFIGDGLADEDGELWDSAGTLVARSRQLALMPRA